MVSEFVALSRLAAQASDRALDSPDADVYWANQAECSGVAGR